MKNLVVFFANYPFYKFHLEKDVGLFSIYLKNEYFDSVTLLKVGEKKENEYSYKNIYVRNLFVSKEPYTKNKNSLLYQLKEFIFAIHYVKTHKDITHIMFFHFNFISNLYFAYRIKKLFPHIKIYDKLDTSDQGAQNIINQLTTSKFSRLKRFFVKSIDYFSVESSSPYQLLQNSLALQDKIFLIPNGIDNISNFDSTPLNKENIIITVGRLGTFQKNTELLLSIINEIDLKDWKVILIGPIENKEKDFESYIKNYYKMNPHLNEKLQFIGNISDKDVLISFYKRAKIFLFTSRFESYGIALEEAAFFGDYIISTETGAAMDITQNGKLGFIAPKSKEFNQNESVMKISMTNHLQNIINGKIDISDNLAKQSSFVKNNYIMDTVIRLPMFKEFSK